MKQFWTVYLPREQVRAYADKTEPTKYPEKFAEFVESSALAKANADKDTLLNCLSHAMFTLDSYRTLVIQHKDRQPMYRLGKHAEEAINLIMAIIRKNGLSVEPEALSEVRE
jgi:hypothetical protein